MKKGFWRSSLNDTAWPPSLELVSRWWVAFRYAPLTHPTNPVTSSPLSGR